LGGGGVHMAQLLRNFKGGLRKVLQKVTKGGEGVQNGEKMRYVIFERPHTESWPTFF
jgi:hypothetical protein